MAGISQVLYKEDEKLLELEVMKEQSRLAEARLDALTKAASKRVGRLESMRKLKDFQRSQVCPAPPQYKGVLEYLSRYGIR